MKPTESLTPPPVLIDGNTGTIRPLTAEGDDYYGLNTASAGTAAIARRLLAVAACGVVPVNGWRCSHGGHAHGVNYVPGTGEVVNTNQWSGMP